MTTLTQLIEHYCPDGVEYVKLGDVASNLDRLRKPVTAKDRIPGPYPYYGANGIQDWVDDYLFEGDFVLLGEDGSVIREDGTPFVHWATGKIWVNNHAHILTVLDAQLSLRFLFHALKNTDVSNFVTGGTQLKVNQQNLNRIPIPLPPREVQDTIVDRLDAFAALVESLDSEIALQEKRCEYFREQIFDEVLSDVQIPKKSLRELGATYGGITGKTKKDFGHGTGRYVPYTAVFSNREVHFDDLQAVDVKPGERQRAIEAGDVLFTGSSESLEEVGFTSVVIQEPAEPIYLNSFCFGFRFNAGVSVSPHFIKHLLMIHHIRKQVMKSANGVTRINISKKSLIKNVILPLPSLEVQQDIADKLDTMQALIANLKQERDLRKTQFEYYSEKLLTFTPRA